MWTLCIVPVHLMLLNLRLTMNTLKTWKSIQNGLKMLKSIRRHVYIANRCETACPQDAIKVARTLPQKRKSGMLERSILIKKNASTARICEELCPGDAIKVKQTGRETFETSG